MIGSYSHFDTIYAAQMVARSAAPRPLLSAQSPLSVAYTFRSQPHTLEDYLARNPTTGLLVARGGTVLFERYQYGRTPADRMTSQSMAKTVIAMLVGIPVSEHAIRSVDDLAAAYVPELAGAELGRTPIRALLHMASGIAFTETYGGTDDIAQMAR
jgi:CubicO group peptidase (beta-lactamase class C family)